jgi:hypothetical protein
MIYSIVMALFFAGLFAESARVYGPGAMPGVGGLAFAGVLLSFVAPSQLFRYSNDDPAALVLTRLMQRGAVGSALLLLTSITVGLLVASPSAPGVFGELYLFTALGIFLFQGFGGVMTHHVMYLQQTHQYNSNQLVAVLLAVTLLLLTLVLYFLAFDLARPPELHAYVRDLLVITLVLVGYGRAVYLMAHH